MIYFNFCPEAVVLWQWPQDGGWDIVDFKVFTFKGFYNLLTKYAVSSCFIYLSWTCLFKNLQ